MTYSNRCSYLLGLILIHIIIIIIKKRILLVRGQVSKEKVMIQSDNFDDSSTKPFYVNLYLDLKANASEFIYLMHINKQIFK